MYSKIVVCIRGGADEVLEKQLNMLSERHKAPVERIEAESGAGYIATCEPTVLLISDDEELLGMAQGRGMATNEPRKMRESYNKAMEMLRAMKPG